MSDPAGPDPAPAAPRPVEETAAALVAENALFAALLADADPGTPVPACPGWTLRELGVHVGRGDRWAAMIVRERSQEFLHPRQAPDGSPTGPLPEWLAAGPRALLDAVAASGATTPVWTIVGPRPAAWWLRRRLHEVAVHRADVALALGVPYAADPALAADGVAEWLDLLVARGAAGGEPPLADGMSLHLHATDPELGEAGEWTVHGDAGGVRWAHGHGKATVAVRGAAADLLLALLRRIPTDDARLAVFGEQAVLEGWLARTGF